MGHFILKRPKVLFILTVADMTEVGRWQSADPPISLPCLPPRPDSELKIEASSLSAAATTLLESCINLWSR